MPSFNILKPNLIIFLHFMDTPKEGFEGEKKPKNKVILWITLVYTLTCPKTFTWGHLNVFDKYLH